MCIIMVVKREGNSFVTLQRAKSREWFTKFCRNDITWIVRTEVLNASGRVSSYSETSTTIIGDLQFGSEILSKYIDLGIALSGDGIFYTTYQYSISENDEIVVDGITWKLVSKIEAEQTLGNDIYQGWIARRKPE